MNKRISFVVLISCLMVSLQGCEILDPSVCTLEARPALVITVTDSATAEPVTGDGVRVIATDGAFVDTAAVESNGVAALAYERSGTYRVEVEAPGYNSWIRESVRVTADECHVRTVEFDAKQQPESLQPE